MMDTTTSSALGGGDEVLKDRYVSCIKVDGNPILPPLMTDERRAEMRRYKELAILKERQLQQSRANSKCTSEIGKEKDCRKLKAGSTFRSATTSPTNLEDPITSTPRVARPTKKILDDTSNVLSTKNLQQVLHNHPEALTASGPGVPESVLRERKIVVIPLDLNRTFSSEPSGRSSPSLSYDGEVDERKNEMVAASDGEESMENFASATSSTGTFVIRKSDEVDNNTDSITIRKSQESLHTTHDNVTTDDEGENAPPTVVRKPAEEPIFSRRKRPAKFFDDEDKDNNADSSKSSVSSSTGYLPNAVPSDGIGRAKSKIPMSFSPVPHTNFSSIAKSITKEFTQKVYATLSSSTFTSSQPKISCESGSGLQYDEIYKDSRLSAEREKYIKEIDTVSNSSDKENINMLESSGSSGKHVRKLSYTLSGPSSILLEAVSKDKNFYQTLDTVPSVPCSVGAPSGQPTPEKPQQQQDNTLQSSYKPKSLNMSDVPPSTSLKDISKPNDPALTSALANLNLGHGKQAHLERFLGEQDQHQNNQQTVTTLSTSAIEDDQVRSILIKMQEEQFKKLQEMAEQHRRQELLLRQQFESEIEKLKEKLSSTLNTTTSSKSNKTSPNSILDSINNSSSVRSPLRLQTAPPANSSSPEESTVRTDVSNKGVSSGMSGLSFSENSKIGMATSVYQFRGDGNLSSLGVTKVRKGAPPAATNDLSAVGLSKLQSRLNLMSPSLFRVPVDAMSPLLKGLVYPDPLDKPRPPVKIPAKALDENMKPKFDKISAAVKGYLTRRVLNTEKVQIIVQTIRDTVDLLMKLYEEAPMSESAAAVKPQDHELHQRLIQQLTGACRSFHDVFFKLSTKERMAIIATDREKLRAKALRLISSPSKPSISTATLKSIERRMSHRSSPVRETRKQRTSKAFDPLAFGSMSVMPKAVKSFNISPKRRRISYWDERNSMNRASAAFDKQDLNGNKSDLKTPINSARSMGSMSSKSSKSLRTYQLGASGGIGDTFIIPSSAPSRNVNSSGRSIARSSTSGKKGTSSKDMNTRSSQVAAIASTSSMTRSSSGRASLSRQQKPWK